MHGGAGLPNAGGKVEDYAPFILRQEWGESPDSASLMLE